MRASARVAVTGIGLASPIGNSLDEVSLALRERRGGIVTLPAWSDVAYLNTRLAGVVTGLALRYPRKKVRTMGRLGLLSVYASEQAIDDAGLDRERLRAPDVGVSYGSTHGSSAAFERLVTPLFANYSLKGLSPRDYLKFMSHTCPANLAQYYGVQGRVITTCSACTSSSQGIGFGYEAIQCGKQTLMLCGGAEEMHFMLAGVFDMMLATSTGYNDRPDESPRPFDAARDGLVVGEGAATLVLESWEHAARRGAHIHAEVVGYATNCDGQHITAPSQAGMADVMRLALQDAELSPSQVDYINAHATATEVGDLCESRAVAEVFGEHGPPISSTKGYTGHTLGACGAIEAAFCVAMMRDGFLAPNRNLDVVDPRCAPLDYLRGDARDTRPKIAMTNNFSFGGINTSLILRAVS